jgi:aspartate kinase
MLMAYGFLRKVFEVFEQHKTPIDMISTSEVAVSLTIDATNNLDSIIAELKKFGVIEVEKNQTIICIVGHNIGKQKGVLEKVFHALASVSVRMVSCGGSNNNISIVIEPSFKVQALTALNEKLFGIV